jgi:drug/metabolite transporter (DMT)-like permease
VIGDPRDKTGYGVALASLGVALAIVLAGICWISMQQGDEQEVAIHGCVLLKGIHCSPDISVNRNTPNAPPGLWVALAGLAGVLVGALIPLPSRAPLPRSRDVNSPPWWLWPAIVGAGAIVAFVVAHDNHESLPLYVAGGLLVGLLLGLLISLPGQED